MPVNQHNVSLEDSPLKLLYSKYAPQAKILYSNFRPLGTVRSESSCCDRDIRMLYNELEQFSDVERVERFLAMSQETPSTDVYVDRVSNDVTSLPDVLCAGSHLSKCQMFENKYKLVAARTNQDTKSQHNCCKRVIQLPMLKINLETHGNETEENKALETTRKSLRKIIDVGRNTTKAAGIINYQFKTPGQSLKDLNSYSNSPLTTGGTNRSTSKRVVFNNESARENFTSRPLINKGDLKLESVADEKSMVPSKSDSVREDITIDSEDEYYSSEDDEKASIMANRLSSAATLGTTRDFAESITLDDSDASDCSNSEISSKRKKSAQTNNTSDRSSDIPQQWPNNSNGDEVADGARKSPVTVIKKDCVQQLHPSFQKARPKGLVKGSSIRLPNDFTNDLVIRNGENGAFPKLVTTSKTKLDPIPKPSNSCTDCPVCNLFRHKETTPCPPNTPRTDSERARTAHVQQPFNKSVLSEIDLSANVDNASSESSNTSAAHSRSFRDKTPKRTGSKKKRKSASHASSTSMSSQHRFGYIESNNNSR